MKPTQEQVIAWAREAGISKPWDQEPISWKLLERFAALAYEAGRESAKLDSTHTCHDQCQRPACVAVREAYEAGRKDENEACAKLCDVRAQGYPTCKWSDGYKQGGAASAVAIRARREQ